MTAPRVLLSRRAQRDLLDIESFIAQRDGDRRAAAIVERLGNAIELLASMPGMGRPRSYLKGDLRAFSVPPWIIMFLPLPGSNGIEVVRVVDARRDLPKLI